MAASTSWTIRSASRLASGGKALATKSWPSASPRSRSTQPTQRFQRGAMALAPRSRAS